MDYRQIIVIISAFCLGLRAITDTGMVFFPIREYFVKHYEKAPLLIKPFILCCTCMASVWGSLIWWGFWFQSSIVFHPIHIYIWIGSCIICAFINGFMWGLYELIKKYN